MKITDLFSEPIWVMWKIANKNGRVTKIPCNEYGQPISITSPPFHTYGSIYQKAIERKYGVGLVFTGNGLVGIDMDKVLNEDQVNAMYWVHQFASYTELSPSKTGLHILVKGTIPGERRRKGRYEIYSNKRFFTFTGDIYMYDTIKEVDLTEFYTTMIAPLEQPRRQNIQIVDYAITDTSSILNHLKNNKTFSSLFYGSLLGYSSYSEAELALCSIVAKVAPDPQLIDSVMRSSYLYRTKWDSKRGEETYGQWTVRKALS